MLSANNNGAGTAEDEVNRNGQLLATYDDAGHLETLFVQRNASGGNCLGGDSCSQAYRYAWDELGRLARARRWDVPTSEFPTVPDSDSTTAAHLRYAYGAGDNRVLKTAIDSQAADPALEARHAAYIFASLELRGTEFDTTDSPGDFVADGTTEVGYLFANGVRLARLVNEPLASGGTAPEAQGLRVFFELGDHLGSHSVALDKATSELVERSTYQAYGGAESSYRPERWGAFREDYRFTGKEEDVEVGLTYFGKRYLNTALQRWVSADPLEIHSAGEADANLYAYVVGQPLRHIDPFGLDVSEADIIAMEMAGGNTMEESLYAREWVSDRVPEEPVVFADEVNIGAEAPQQDTRTISDARISGVKDTGITVLQGVVSVPPNPMLAQDPYFEEIVQRDVAALEQARDPVYAPALEAARQDQALYSSVFLATVPLATRTPSFGFRPSYVGVAQLKATDYARLVMSTTAKRKWPNVVSASVDLSSGRTAFAESGVKLFDGVPQLRLRMPGPQLTPHPAWNCADIRACNINVTSGVPIQRQELHNLRLVRKTEAAVPVERCPNCKITTSGANVTSD